MKCDATTVLNGKIYRCTRKQANEKPHQVHALRTRSDVYKTPIDITWCSDGQIMKNREHLKHPLSR